MISLRNNLIAKSSSQKRILWLNLSPVILAVILSILIAFFPISLPAKLPLFYSLPWGESQIVNSQQFFIIPATIILISLINLALSWQLHPTQTFFKKILLISSLICTLILTIALIKIVLIFI